MTSTLQSAQRAFHGALRPAEPRRGPEPGAQRARFAVPSMGSSLHRGRARSIGEIARQDLDVNPCD